MKFIKFILSLFFTLTLICLLNCGFVNFPLIGHWFDNTALSKIPPIGKFIDPFHGFWKNAELATPSFDEQTKLDALKAPVKIISDNRLVPHIFAENEHDLYFMQGYVTAQYRLWQMEFQTHAAAGRVSEIVGDRALEYDKRQRRMGMTFAAANMQEKVNEDTLAFRITQAYTNGVNAYIEQLNYGDLPIEYKLLDYCPEPWTTFKTALLGKSMAARLAGYEEDWAMTNALDVFGAEWLPILYPDQVLGQDPIIPSGTEWDFEALPVPEIPASEQDSTEQIKSDIDPSATSWKDREKVENKKHLPSEAHPLNGSNNWAVSGLKTASKRPILCSDPHLKLHLPSIWFEIQLSLPGMNTYGVSLPGAPNVVIGFNDKIAWGVTNGEIDVKDWYALTFKDDSKEEYFFDGKWKKTTRKLEEIKLKNGSSIIDTVIYTHIGPVNEHEKYGDLALRWKAHDASNELFTFYYLNRANNYADYLSALQHYESPAQNFVFADMNGDIAIWHQGKYPLKWPGQGKFVLDAALPEHQWKEYIPQSHNPHSLNPERGFVSSANQHPTDNTYPYFYNGNFEFYRNRRINQQLASMQTVTVEDMRNLQNDNYNLKAAESLPGLMAILDSSTLSKEEDNALELLKKWNYINDLDTKAASIYEEFWSNLYSLVWDEMAGEAPNDLPYPEDYITVQMLITNPDNEFMDIKATKDVKENATDLVKKAFSDAVTTLYNRDEEWNWGNYKKTNINHLLEIPEFSAKELHTSGHPDMVNAIGKTSGPSWRMIVAFPDMDENGNGSDGEIKAWGVYPGGQSGNPGSPNYDSSIDKWVKGEYYRLNFLKTPESISEIASEDGEVVTFYTEEFVPN